MPLFLKGILKWQSFLMKRTVEVRQMKMIDRQIRVLKTTQK
jgi:hypothetical protein